MDKTLSVKNLSISFADSKNTVQAVRDLSFEVGRGDILGVVGESACGKTVTCRAILGLNKGAKTTGTILFGKKDILRLKETELRKIRGSRISMVFQNPSSSLNPVVKIGKQMIEVIRFHQDVGEHKARDIAISLLTDMGIQSPEQKLNEYPHQQSQGVNQRIMIAIAVSCEPDILVADEPTSALDVTVQRQLLQIFSKLKEEKNIGLIFVTHDLGVIYEIADRVLVMYRGMLMEEADTQEIFENPLHPYTRLLLSSIPRFGESKILLKGAQNHKRIVAQGCVFGPRCPEFMEEMCINTTPKLCGTRHKVRCSRRCAEKT
jgi:oligopeptide/dipeptide ABC transporter ATP-binding protein